MGQKLEELISLWASGGFHDSQAALEEFEEHIEGRLKKQREMCADAITVHFEKPDKFMSLQDVCLNATGE